MTAFLLSVRWGGRESVADLLGHSLTAKGGIEGCWSGRLVRPDEQVPLSISALASALPLDRGTIGPHIDIGPNIAPYMSPRLV